MKVIHSHAQSLHRATSDPPYGMLLTVIAGFVIALVALAIGLNLTDPELLAGAAFGPLH